MKTLMLLEPQVSQAAASDHFIKAPYKLIVSFTFVFDVSAFGRL